MRTLACVVLLVLMAVVVYLPAVRNGFVNYDDQLYVTDNGFTQMGLTWAGTVWAFRTMHGSNWMPLTWLSHSLDVQLFGLDPAGHHAMSLVLHVASTLILFSALRRMTGATARALVVAALFAVHPLHVESVAWVAERKDVLSGFFWMAALWMYAAYTRRPGVVRYLGVTVLFVLGLMAKPMVVTLPCALLLLDGWPLGRLRGQVAGCVLEKVPWFVLSLGSAGMAVFSQHHGGAIGDFADYPVWVRFANAIVSYVAYLCKMVWPFGLAAFYPHPGTAISLAHVAWCAAFLGAITLVCWLGRRRFPYAAMGWCWYLGTLVPVIGIVQIGRQAMADRYTYLPLIGVFAAVAWGVGDAWQKYRLPQKALWVLAGSIVAALGVRTLDQVPVWRDGETLFKHALRVTQDNEVMRYSLGSAYLEQGRYDEAETELKAALRIEPQHLECITNLGIVLLKTNRSDEADMLFKRALQIEPHHANTLMNRGVLLTAKGEKEQALACFQQAVEYAPEDVNAHYGLGLALLQTGRVVEAGSHLRSFLRVHPERMDVRRLFAKACMGASLFADAAAQYVAMAQALPDNAEVFANLGIALASLNRNEEAVAALRRACALRPADWDLRFNFIRTLVSAQQWQEASQVLTEYLLERPNDPEAHYLLGVALGGSGKRNEAAQQFRETLRLQPGHRESIQYLRTLGEPVS